MRAYNSILGVEIFLWIFDIMRTKKTQICTDFGKIVRILKCCRIFSIQNDKNPYKNLSRQKICTIRTILPPLKSLLVNLPW